MEDQSTNVFQNHTLSQKNFYGFHHDDEYDAYSDPKMDRSICNLINQMNRVAPNDLRTVHSCASHPDQGRSRFYIMFHVTEKGVAILFDWEHRLQNTGRWIQSTLRFGYHMHRKRLMVIPNVPCVIWEIKPINDISTKHQLIQTLSVIVDHDASKNNV